MEISDGLLFDARTQIEEKKSLSVPIANFDAPSAVLNAPQKLPLLATFNVSPTATFAS